jgi:hypothetical protein
MIVTDYEQKDDGSKEEGVGKTGGKPRKLSGVKKKKVVQTRPPTFGVGNGYPNFDRMKSVYVHEEE